MVVSRRLHDCFLRVPPAGNFAVFVIADGSTHIQRVDCISAKLATYYNQGFNPGMLSMSSAVARTFLQSLQRNVIAVVRLFLSSWISCTGVTSVLQVLQNNL